MDNNENTSDVKFCVKCGCPLIPGARFCPKCGSAVVRPAVAAAPVIPAAGETPETPFEAPVEAPAETAEGAGFSADNTGSAELIGGETVIPGIIDESSQANGPQANGTQTNGAWTSGSQTDGYQTNGSETGETAGMRTNETAGMNEPPRTAKQTVDDEFIRQMRAFEASKREQEQARRARAAAPVTRGNENTNAKRGGIPGWLVAVIVVAAVLVTALFTGAVVARLAANSGSRVDRSSVERIIDDYISKNPSLGQNNGQTGNKPNQDHVVDGETVPGGSQVTINIEGDSTSVAAAVYAKCAQSVVGVGIYGKTSSTPWAQSSFELIGSGSGVIYRSDGYIITNHHVIDDAIDDDNQLRSDHEIRVYTDETLGSYYTATVVGADATADLALIKIEETGLVPIEFEDIENVAVGDMVFSLGCPGGLEFMGTLSNGIVGGINKNLLTEDGYAFDLILTDAAINPGISGGALVNAKGKLVGICELKIIETNYESMGFAISVETVKKISETLYKDGKVVRPALGVAVNTSYGPKEANESGAPAGAWVSEVTKGSAADIAGIKPNMIITEVNGVEVYDYVSLRAQLLKYTVGEKVEIKAYVYSGSNVKNGTYKIFTVTLQVLEE